MKKTAAIILSLCLAAGMLTSAFAEDKTYKIGVLQFIQHAALDAATQGFKDALTEKLGDRVTFVEQNASGEVSNCAIIATSLVAERCDLYLGNATPALQALANATFDAPVLGTSITDYATALDIDGWTGVTGFNVSGTSDLAPLDRQAEMVLELFPDAKTVGLLYCSAEANSVYQVNAVRSCLEERGIACTDYSFADSNDLASVAQMATECDVIYIPTDNTCASYVETIANVVIPAGTPVITGEEGICAGCGVATLSISYYDLGYATGLMAYDILVGGADVTKLAIAYAPEVTRKYNPAIVEALGIVIPEDYVAIGQ
ncbi:MAG: ABC transporter substrate-binding protein [Clostridia bacterium]|nr:ABC transporter substrate-binding protein [Clostridia bacterium]